LLTTIGDRKFIAAFQAKNWTKRLGPADVAVALKSIDPKLFFSPLQTTEKSGTKSETAKVGVHSFAYVYFDAKFTFRQCVDS
jgi:hypothetical protein